MAWLCLAIAGVEVLVWIKFSKGQFPHVKVFISKGFNSKRNNNNNSNNKLRMNETVCFSFLQDDPSWMCFIEIFCLFVCDGTGTSSTRDLVVDFCVCLSYCVVCYLLLHLQTKERSRMKKLLLSSLQFFTSLVWCVHGNFELFWPKNLKLGTCRESILSSLQKYIESKNQLDWNDSKRKERRKKSNWEEKCSEVNPNHYYLFIYMRVYDEF